MKNLLDDYLALRPDVFELFRSEDDGFMIVGQEQELYSEYLVVVDEGDITNIIPFSRNGGFGWSNLRAIAQGIEVFLENYA